MVVGWWLGGRYVEHLTSRHSQRSLRERLASLDSADVRVVPRRSDQGLRVAGRTGLAPHLRRLFRPCAGDAAGGTGQHIVSTALPTIVGELSDGWQPEQHPELRELIEGLARQFIDTTPVALPPRTS